MAQPFEPSHPSEPDFILRAGSPSLWLSGADTLKLSADLIYAVLPQSIDDFTGPPISPKITFVFCAPVGKMLLGMSFECLLKGLLVANGLPAVVGGVLNEVLSTHKLHVLAQRLPPTIPVSAAELAILKDLSDFVFWRGRYPVPKRPTDDYGAPVVMAEYVISKQLWRRLFDHLKPLASQTAPPAQ